MDLQFQFVPPNIDQFLLYLCSFIVGIVFLLTGFIKSVNSGRFIAHLSLYKIIPLSVILLLGLVFIGIESAVGAGLIFNVFPKYMLTSSIILLIILSLLNFWSTTSGLTEDCGCYGGIIIISPKQSLILNAFYILLLCLASLHPFYKHQTEPWKLILILTIFAITMIFAWFSRENPLVDISRLKIGNKWGKYWLKNAPYNLHKGSHIIVFLSEDCPYCKRWIPFLNTINNLTNLPKLTAIMSLPLDKSEAFKIDHKISFEIVSIDKILLSYMIEAFPTAVLVNDGIISNKWEGELPGEFMDHIRHFYEKSFSSEFIQKQDIQKPEESVYSELSLITISPQHYYIHLDNFLQREQWECLLNWTLTQQVDFTSSTTSSNELDYRKSMVLHSFPDFSELMTQKISSILPIIQDKLDLEAFTVSQIEAQLTAHNDGNYYNIHNDNGSWDTLNRELTYVYYFYREPKPFSGGELVIYNTNIVDNAYVKGNKFKTIEPRNNSLIVFPSYYLHEVLPVNCSSQSFSDSRFTINGWVRKAFFHPLQNTSKSETNSIELV